MKSGTYQEIQIMRIPPTAPAVGGMRMSPEATAECRQKAGRKAGAGDAIETRSALGRVEQPEDGRRGDQQVLAAARFGVEKHHGAGGLADLHAGGDPAAGRCG